MEALPRGRAYGENNSILDNAHVRIAFEANDERTARRISDSLGTATELRAHAQYTTSPTGHNQPSERT